MATDYITQADDIATVEAKVRSSENLKYPTTYEGRTFWHKLRSSDILRLFGVGGKDGNGPIPAHYEAQRMIGDTLVRIRAAGPEGKSRHRRRVQAQCNHCGTWVCAGHLDQHRNTRACDEAVGTVWPHPDSLILAPSYVRTDDDGNPIWNKEDVT